MHDCHCESNRDESCSKNCDKQRKQPIANLNLDKINSRISFQFEFWYLTSCKFEILIIQNHNTQKHFLFVTINGQKHR